MELYKSTMSDASWYGIHELWHYYSITRRVKLLRMAGMSQEKARYDELSNVHPNRKLVSILMAL